MLSNRAKWRLIERKCAHDGVFPMMHYGKVYFAEKIRRPYVLKDKHAMIMAEFLEPITPFNDGDYWWKYLLLRKSRKTQTREEKAAIFMDPIDSERERAEAELDFKWKDVGSALREASVEARHFSMPAVPNKGG